ncbi:MFS transporter [Histidinibacterium aquaticum]|nr:MFS transporter [Histidinibacterium aquaticum]
MLQPIRLILADPALRVAAGALVLFGSFAASIAPYQSLIAIRIFGFSDAAYSAVLVLAAVISVAGAVGIGVLTDRMAARKKAALLSALLGAAATAWILAVPGAWSFALVHGILLPIAGSLMGQIFALARLAAGRLTPDERDSVLAGIRALFALPFIVVLPLWSVAFEAGAGLLAIYIALAGLCLGMALLIRVAWPEDGEGGWEEVPSGLSLAESLREIASGGVLLRVTMTGAINAGVFLYLIVLGLMFDESVGRGLGDVAIFAGVVAGLEVPVMLSMGALLRRITRLQAILWGAALYAGFLFAFPLLVATPLVWLLTIPAAIGGGIVLSLPIAYVQDLMGTRAGAGGALLAVQKVAGDGIAAALFAGATLLGGYGLAAWAGGLSMILGAGALLWLDRRRDPLPAE